MAKTEKQIKLEHFQNLVAVAYSDGHLDINEAEFLAERAEEYGLPKDIVDTIIDNVNNLEFIIPLNDEEKEEQLTDSVYMAMVDGSVDQREYDLCLKIAQKLDFDQQYLDDIIRLTKDLWEKGINL